MSAHMIAAPVKSTAYAEVTRLGPHVEAFLASKLGSRQFTPKTCEGYRYALARMALMFPDQAPGDFTVEDLEFVRMAFPVGSRDWATNVLKSFWKWMRRRGHVRENPAELLDPVKREQRLDMVIFTDAEVEALEAQPEIRDGALMTILFDTGIRMSEARALQLLHVNLEHAFVTVVRGKGGKGRIIPISAATVRRIADLALLDGLAQADFLWYGYTSGTRRITRHKEIDTTRFYRWWRGCLATVGVSYRNPHTTRHTMATRWLRDGEPLHTLSKMMGHASEATTADKYGHLQLADLAASVRRLESMRGRRRESAAKGASL